MPLRLFRSRERSGAYAARMLYLGRDDRVLLLHHPVPAGRPGLHAPAGRPGLPAHDRWSTSPSRWPSRGWAARVPNGTLVAVGIAVTLAGMAWLEPGRASVARTSWRWPCPMVLVGAGQGLAFAPLTSAGIAGVAPADAGAASGLVNTAHQLGMALGLALLVSVAAGGGAGLDGPEAVADHVRSALAGSTVLVGLALVVALACLVPHRAASSAPTTRQRPTRRHPHDHPHVHPQQRSGDAGPRVRRLPDAPRRDARGRDHGPGRRLPARRHRGGVRQRARRR